MRKSVYSRGSKHSLTPKCAPWAPCGHPSAHHGRRLGRHGRLLRALESPSGVHGAHWSAQVAYLERTWAPKWRPWSALGRPSGAQGALMGAPAAPMERTGASTWRAWCALGRPGSAHGAYLDTQVAPMQRLLKSRESTYIVPEDSHVGQTILQPWSQKICTRSRVNLWCHGQRNDRPTC